MKLLVEPTYKSFCFLQMGFEMPLSGEAVRVFLRLNQKIANLSLELKRKNQQCEALKKENETIKEKIRKRKGKKVEQVKRWKKITRIW